MDTSQFAAWFNPAQSQPHPQTENGHGQHTNGWHSTPHEPAKDTPAHVPIGPHANHTHAAAPAQAHPSLTDIDMAFALPDMTNGEPFARRTLCNGRW
jgi:hypothetical protein